MKWARGLSLPSRGDYYLYTGCMYQSMHLVDTVVKLSRIIERVPGWLGKAAAKVLGSMTPLVGLLGGGSRYEEILRSIVGLLKRSGIDVAYAYDSYCGVILHDLGLEDLFIEATLRITEDFRRLGIRRLVTVDPHTTFMLREVYPKLIDGFDIEVYHYLELVNNIPKVSGEYVIHDPCYLARRLNMWGRVRGVLREAGISVREPVLSRGRTFCCGGPAEAISPSMSFRIGEERMRQLLSTGAREVIVACPICLLNLGRASTKVGGLVVDLAEVLHDA